jgi:hypothetical protein
MATVESNLAEFERTMAGLERALSWDGPSFQAFGSLADEVADLVADDVIDRSLGTAIDYHGAPWPELAPRTRARKPNDQIGVESGAMMDKRNVRGRVFVHGTEMTMTYGLDGWDIQKAEWFERGNSGPGRRVQPARPFYGVDERTDQLVQARMRRHLESFAAQFNRGR